jgi:hypothetical protein
VGAGCAPPGRARGDPGISTAQPPLGRLIPGVLALVIAGGIATVSLQAASGTLPLLAGSVGLLGVGVLGVVLVTTWPGGIGAAVALLGTGYLGHTIVAADAAPLVLVSVSVSLLLVGELTQWSLDRRLRGSYEVGLEASRAAATGLLVVVGAGAAALGLAVTGIAIPGGMAAQAAAVAASVALLALVASVARRKRGGDERIETG